ncbi:MAG: TonB-dependent copper receptor [Marinomonas sp.]
MSKTTHCDALRPQNNTRVKTARANNSSHFTKLPLVLTIMGASLSTTSTYADELTTDDDVILKNAIVVSAPSEDSPVTSTIDLNETPALQSASDGASVLTQIPGFSAVGNGGTNGDPTFRGMFGSRVAILTDGAQMLGACPSRMDNPSAYINPTAYDSVSVVKGPETVLWGAGNSAATVRFDRKEEDFSDKNARLEANVMVGSYGRIDRSIDGAIGNDVGYIRIQANESESNDYKDGNGDSVDSSWDKWNTNIALGWTPDKDTLFELSYGRSDGYAEYAGRSMDGVKFYRETAALRFEKTNISEHWSKVEAQINYGYADHAMDNYTYRTPSMMSMFSELSRRTESGRIASTWDWDPISWTIGVDAEQEVHISGITSSYDGYEDYSKRQAGVFSELTWNVNDQHRMITGARIDTYSATDETSTSSTAGETRSATLYSGFSRWERDFSSIPATMYIGLGHVERFPDYWEMQSDTDSDASNFNSADPEKTTQLDVGLNYNGKQFSWWVSAYAGYVRNYILFDYTTDDTQVSNVDAIIAGAEVGGRYQLTHNWSINASTAYAWGEDITYDSALPQISPLEAKFGATYEYGHWTTNGVVRMVAAQNRVSEGYGNVTGYDLGDTSGFTTMDINQQYDFNKYLTWRIGIDNLMDKAYTEHLNKAGDASNSGYSDSSTYTQFNEPGRIFWTSLTLRI